MMPRATPSPPAATPSVPGVVLIVDDDRPIADFVAAVVAEAGYTPLVATRGAQALELAQERWPALLITDLMLPFMSGGALIAALRAAAETAGRAAPTMVLMTAASPRLALAAGAEAVLRKPFDLADLEAVLRHVLGTPPAGQAEHDRPSHP